MKTIMKLDELKTILQLGDFLAGTQPLAFSVSGDKKPIGNFPAGLRLADYYDVGRHGHPQGFPPPASVPARGYTVTADYSGACPLT